MSKGTGTTIEVNSRFHKLMPRDEDQSTTKVTPGALTEREAVKKYLDNKISQLKKRVMSATARRPKRSPYLASVDRVMHHGGLTQIAI